MDCTRQHCITTRDLKEFGTSTQNLKMNCFKHLCTLYPIFFFSFTKYNVIAVSSVFHTAPCPLAFAADCSHELFCVRKLVPLTILYISNNQIFFLTQLLIFGNDEPSRRDSHPSKLWKWSNCKSPNIVYEGN